MAANLPRAASTARALLAGSLRATASRRVVLPSRQPTFRPQQLFARYASHAPTYDPAPEQIQSILDEGAQPELAEHWRFIGESALSQCKTPEERAAVLKYIQDALKPKFTDDEILAIATQAGVALKSPHDIDVARATFKTVMCAATLDEANALFTYYAQHGEFPVDIEKAIRSSLNSALKAPAATAGHHNHHDHGHADAHHGHAEPVNEPIGRGFWIALGVIPFSFLLYTFSKSKDTDNEPFLSRWIRSYDSWQEEWKLRGEMHTKMIEQAGADKLLFLHSEKAFGSGLGKRQIRFNEQINSGAPLNVAPGSYINVDKVIDHYQKLNEENDQERQRIHEWHLARELKNEYKSNQPSAAS